MRAPSRETVKSMYIGCSGSLCCMAWMGGRSSEYGLGWRFAERALALYGDGDEHEEGLRERILLR